MVRNDKFDCAIKYDLLEFLDIAGLDVQTFNVALGVKDLRVVVPKRSDVKGAFDHVQSSVAKPGARKTPPPIYIIGTASQCPSTRLSAAKFPFLFTEKTLMNRRR